MRAASWILGCWLLAACSFSTGGGDAGDAGGGGGGHGGAGGGGGHGGAGGGGGHGGAGGGGGQGGAGGGGGGAYCTPSHPEGPGFDDGPSGLDPFDRAGDFTLPTTAGSFSLSAHFTGCESVLFVLHRRDQPYARQLWTSSIVDLVSSSPPGAHYLFLSYETDPARVAEDVAEISGWIDAELATLSAEEAAYWRDRLHVVTVGAMQTGTWITSMLRQRGVFAFAIDRFQRLREVGLLFAPGGRESAQLSFLTHEAKYFDWEWRTEQRLASERARTIPLFGGERVQGDGFAEAELPPAEEMAVFDALELDVRLGCPGRVDEGCGEWDYLVYLYLCDADAPESCGTEVGRFITSYRRGARFVTDATFALAFLQEGGRRRFRFQTQNAYDLEVTLRLLDRGRADRPVAAIPLFAGGAYDAGYNERQQPRTVDVPAGATRVQLAALISGHGFGVERANCAEFCDHAHHFAVNGGDEHVRAHPEAGTSFGCLRKVSQGVTPNQYGTWTFGRGGWCPGFDVPPFVVDVTDEVVPGEAATVTYRSLVDGAPYVPAPRPGEGFPARLDLTSWLVIWR